MCTGLHLTSIKEGGKNPTGKKKMRLRGDHKFGLSILHKKGEK